VSKQGYVVSREDIPLFSINYITQVIPLENITSEVSNNMFFVIYI
jgi:hypothetical protein